MLALFAPRTKLGGIRALQQHDCERDEDNPHDRQDSCGEPFAQQEEDKATAPSTVVRPVPTMPARPERIMCWYYPLRQGSFRNTRSRERCLTRLR